MNKTKTIGWDGLSFQAPVDWDPDALGPGYLRISDGNLPMLELKWRQKGGDFTSKNHFSKLTSKLKSQTGIEVQKTVMPSDWKSATKKFQATAFFWRSETVAGRGLVLFQAKTKAALLIQFFEQNAKDESGEFEKILSTLEFARDGQHSTWAVFDIILKAPQATLGKHSFKPGLFELTLNYPKHKLEIARIGPSKIMLSDSTLTEIAQKRFSSSFPKEIEPENLGFKGFEAISWDRPWPDGIVSKVQKTLTKQMGCKQLLMWHDHENQRILSVLYSGRTAPTEDEFMEVCQSYEII